MPSEQWFKINDHTRDLPTQDFAL